jgi:hypothetical protein
MWDAEWQCCGGTAPERTGIGSIVRGRKCFGPCNCCGTEDQLKPSPGLIARDGKIDKLCMVCIEGYRSGVSEDELAQWARRQRENPD